MDQPKTKRVKRTQITSPVSMEEQNAFSALTLLVERQEEHPACTKTEWFGTGMVICLK